MASHKYPHTWSTYETTGELHPFIRNPFESDNPYWWMGWGWYRKHFSVNREFSDCKVLLSLKVFRNIAKSGLMVNILVIIKEGMVLSILILQNM